MKSITVHTREELILAKDQNIDEIIVSGELAEKLKKAIMIKKLSVTGLAILVAGVTSIAIATAPVTAPAAFLGGVATMSGATAIVGGGAIASGAGGVVVATLTGLEIATIIAATSLGITLIIAIYKGYEEIEYSKDRLVLRKRKS
ncbi:MAG: hypothetical protein ACOYMG_19705 [Candidatus Methylumidiphilus sp.]